MLRHYGAEKVAVLDGGFQKWTSEGRPTESGEPTPREARFEARERPDEVVTKQQLLAGEVRTALLDARGKGRFEGSEPDPRPGVEPGHIPGACNLPFGALYNEDGTFRSRDEIRRLFAEADVDPFEPFTASCGSGVTAISLIFAALHLNWQALLPILVLSLLLCLAYRRTGSIIPSRAIEAAMRRPRKTFDGMMVNSLPHLIHPFGDTSCVEGSSRDVIR